MDSKESKSKSKKSKSKSKKTLFQVGKIKQ